MEQRKTDESLNAGAQMEATTNPVRKKRKRIPLAKKAVDTAIAVDDVVHEPEFEPTAVFNKENSDVSGDHNTGEKDADDQGNSK